MSASWRYEVKLVGDECALPALRGELLLHPSGLLRQYPARVVQSVYLDTHEGDAVDDNLAGILERSKIRFRWYGEAARGVRGRLERKLRRAELGSKQAVELAAARDVEGCPRQEWMARLRADLPPRWQVAVAGLEPVQWIRYEREYFVTADRRVRVTFDRGLRACDLRSLAVLSAARPTPLPRICVIEIKGDRQHRDEVEALVGAVPLPVGRCSKFVLASAPGHGPLLPR